MNTIQQPFLAVYCNNMQNPTKNHHVGGGKQNQYAPINGQSLTNNYRQHM